MYNSNRRITLSDGAYATNAVGGPVGAPSYRMLMPQGSQRKLELLTPPLKKKHSTIIRSQSYMNFPCIPTVIKPDGTRWRTLQGEGDGTAPSTKWQETAKRRRFLHGTGPPVSEEAVREVLKDPGCPRDTGYLATKDPSALTGGDIFHTLHNAAAVAKTGMELAELMGGSARPQQVKGGDIFHTLHNAVAIAKTGAELAELAGGSRPRRKTTLKGGDIDPPAVTAYASSGSSGGVTPPTAPGALPTPGTLPTAPTVGDPGTAAQVAQNSWQMYVQRTAQQNAAKQPPPMVSPAAIAANAAIPMSATRSIPLLHNPVSSAAAPSSTGGGAKAMIDSINHFHGGNMAGAGIKRRRASPGPDSKIMRRARALAEFMRQRGHKSMIEASKQFKAEGHKY